MNKQYSDKEREEIDIMTKFAVMVLKDGGMTFEEVAVQENVTAEYVAEMVEKIKEINPVVYYEVTAMKFAKMYLNEGMSYQQIAVQENIDEAEVAEIIEQLKGVNPTVYSDVQKKLAS